MSGEGYSAIERSILDRLGSRQPIYLAHPDRQAAARDLAQRGLVRLEVGEGDDRGLLLVWRGAGWRKNDPHPLLPGHDFGFDPPGGVR